MPSGDPLSNADVAVRVATTPLTTNSATWTTTESGALITASALLTNGWTYAVTAILFVNSTAAADVGFMRIHEDTATGTQDVGENVYMATTSANGWPVTLYAEYTASATATKTFVVTGSRTAGTGTMGIVATTTRPCFLKIDRIVS